ncbi:hypothetical protein BJ912DRAFT_929599 [Pholiota molesta]|nr:hypothetical protein BJ912DRAFT_929599 [Pholiota molesta]
MQGPPPHGPPDHVQLPSFASLFASIAQNPETVYPRRHTPPPTTLLTGRTPITPTRLGVTYTPHSTPQRASRDARSANASDHLRASSSRAPLLPSPYARPSRATEGSSTGRLHSGKNPSSASASQKQPSARRTMIDWARVMPGQRLKLLGVDIVITMAPLATQGMVELLTCPRSVDYCTDAEYVIEFAVRDMPGPSVHLLATGGCHLDEGSEEVFKRYGLAGSLTVDFRFDWPGIAQRNECIVEASTLTRAQLAAILASSITQSVTDLKNGQKVQILDGAATVGWDLCQVDMNKLRLFSLNYYKHSKTWVPLLAYEISIPRDRHQ